MPKKKVPIEKQPADTARVISEYLSNSDLASVAAASPATSGLFQPLLKPRAKEKLLSALYMGDEALVEKIIGLYPDLLFAHGTYIMPLLNQDGTKSHEYEQACYDVTPLKLSLYTGDFKIWERLLPLIPIELIDNVLTEIHMLSRGGPDLVKIDRDPRTLSLEELRQFHAGEDAEGNPIVYDLLCNPDGIFCFQDQFFYVNQETQEVLLLEPQIISTDEDAFATLQTSINEDMIDNSSCRTSDKEHALIERVFGRKLERNGIRYELNGVHYQDTYDGGIRLMNAYRKYLTMYHANLPLEVLGEEWIHLASKLRIAPVHIVQRHCEKHVLFNPLPSKEDMESEPFDRTDEFFNASTGQTERFYPCKVSSGVGFDVGIYKAYDGRYACATEHVSMVDDHLPAICQLAEVEKICRMKFIQALENKRALSLGI